MKHKNYWLPVCVLAIMVFFVFGGRARASQADQKSVRQAVAGFYSALDAMFSGNLEPMKKVWSHSENITYMGPDGGYEIGWQQALGSWQKQAAMKLGGKVEPAKIHIIMGREIAVVDNYEQGINSNAAGKQQRLLLRATSVFRKEDGKWKMVGHHTDTLPYLKN
jgi:ketosteroid isomerase-like protein